MLPKILAAFLTILMLSPATGMARGISDQEIEECRVSAQEKFDRALEGCDALENPAQAAREACYERAEKRLRDKLESCGQPRLQ